MTDATPPIDRTVVANGLRLHFLDWLGAGKPPLILLHGALLQAHVWDFFSLALRTQFHIRALDLPGHGDSEWAVDGVYSRVRIANDVVAFIEQLELQAPVIVGHSLGGAVGAVAAARLRDRLRALVMVDSTLLASGQPSMRSRAARLPPTFASFEEFAQHAARLRGDVRPARPMAGLRWNARQLADGHWTWKYDPAVRHAVVGPSDYEDIWEALRNFAGPILFVRAGEHSHLSDPAASRLRELPNVRLVVVPGARHNVMTDKPVEFKQVVAEFLVELEPRDSTPNARS